MADGRMLSGIVDFFEEGVAAGKGVLEFIGNDVAAFCDELVKDSRTCADNYQESISGRPRTAEQQHPSAQGAATAAREARVAWRADVRPGNRATV